MCTVTSCLDPACQHVAALWSELNGKDTPCGSNRELQCALAQATAGGPAALNPDASCSVRQPLNLSGLPQCSCTRACSGAPKSRRSCSGYKQVGDRRRGWQGLRCSHGACELWQLRM